eukprot:354031-Chlamydomonas_euryale.AAC.2
MIQGADNFDRLAPPAACLAQHIVLAAILMPTRLNIKIAPARPSDDQPGPLMTIKIAPARPSDDQPSPLMTSPAHSPSSNLHTMTT